MTRCPRCGQPLETPTPFCPHCGTQLRVQRMEGIVVDPEAGVRTIDPLRALRLSIIPGLGHWYAGAPLRGLAFFAAIVGPIAIGTELDLTAILLPLGIPLDLGGLGLWVLCALDAYRTAKKRSKLVT